MTPTASDIELRMQDVDALLAAMNEARGDALRRHASAGVPVVVWSDGKVIELPPEVALAEHFRHKQARRSGTAA
jgi:hypothetical protein